MGHFGLDNTEKTETIKTNEMVPTVNTVFQITAKSQVTFKNR